MITRALRFCAGGVTVARAILAGAAATLAVVPLAASPAQAGVIWSGKADVDTPVIVVQPSITQAAAAMTPTVKVYVAEPHTTKPDPDFNGLVTLNYAINPNGAPEPTGNVARATRGVATFPDLSFSAVGFGFELIASIPHEVNAQPSTAFDIVTQYVTCQAGQSCQSGTVRSGNTSGSSVAAAGSSAGFLAATAGGFPALSCTTVGGVLTFSASNPQTITIKNPGPVKPPKHRPRPWPSVCRGAPQTFTTASGKLAELNPANGDYEGLLPSCGPREQVKPPCVLWSGFGFGHSLAARVLAPAGDPHITF
jgi:hypothetical protein